MPHGHGHVHAPGGHAHHGHAHGSPVEALRVALLVTAALLVLQVAGGLVSKSLALLADAAHLLADLGGLALAYTAARLASRPATPLRSYGLYRVEILATLANGVVLLGLSGFILFEAWHRFSHPEPVKPLVMIAVASLSLVGNFVSLSVLKKSTGSLNVRAAYLEVVADTLGAGGVFLAGLIILPTGWLVVDPILSAILSIAIVPRTLSLLREALHVLLEGTPPGLDHRVIETELKSMQGVADVHDLHVWSLTSGMPVLTAHVVVGEGASCDETGCDDLLDRIGARLKEVFSIDHTTIQIEHADRARREDARF
jgi:cobalt-zinc-cadmium efflux system protein